MKGLYFKQRSTSPQGCVYTALKCGFGNNWENEELPDQPASMSVQPLPRGAGIKPAGAHTAPDLVKYDLGPCWQIHCLKAQMKRPVSGSG